MDGTAVHTLERWAWRLGLSLLPLLGVLPGAPAQAQPTPRVSISLTNEPLREALLHLERVTPLRFAYVDTLVTPHTVSITAEDDLLPDVLDRLLHPLGIGWTQRGQQVILRGQAPTPPTLTMQGRVVDAATGLVLPLAHVRLVATGQATVTDGQGRFSFTGLAPGAYEIEARYLGYTTQRWTLTPPEVRTLRLAPTPLAVGELVVAADVLPAVQRPDTAGLLRLVPEALERLPAIGEPDVLRALLTTPGVHVGHDASIGLFIRGGTPDQHLIRLDGMTLYQVDHLFGVFSPFNPDALHAVHVFKGGFPASYGARTGSVINLESHPALDRPGPTPPRLRVRAGLLSTSVAVRGPLRPRLDGAVAVRRALTDLWTSPLAATVVDVSTGEAIDEEAEERRFGFSDLHATLRWRRTPTDQWSLHGFASRDRFEQRDAPSTPEEAPDILETLTSRWTTGAGSLRWQRQWHPRVKTTATWTRSSYQTRYDLTSTLDLDPFYALSLRNTVDEWAVRLDGEAALGTAHTLRLGASYTDLRVGLREIQEERRIRDDDREALTALYVEDRWRLAPSLTVTTGLRATQARESEQLFLAPRAAFQWQPTRTWTLHGAWGHYRQWTGRVVNENVLDGPRDLWVILPNVSESRHQSLGVRYDGRLGRATLEAYRQRLRGVAVFSERFTDDPTLFDFFGTGAAYGVETSVQRRVGPVRTRWAYTYARVHYRFDALNDGRSFPALHDRPHTVKGVLEWGRGPWMLTAFGLIHTGRPVTPVEGAFLLEGPDGAPVLGVQPGRRNQDRLPTYHRVDLTLHHRTQRARTRWTTSLALFNVFDRANAWYREVEIEDGIVRQRTVRMLGFLPSLSLRLDLP